jgi:hypothetical protein
MKCFDIMSDVQPILPFSGQSAVGCIDISSIDKLDPVNQFVQDDDSRMICTRDGIEVPVEFHQRLSGYGRMFEFIVLSYSSASVRCI